MKVDNVKHVRLVVKMVKLEKASLFVMLRPNG